jgi:peptidoglycan/xylan/chitin deacetylase (PgdA/CDA1 family)
MKNILASFFIGFSLLMSCQFKSDKIKEDLQEARFQVKKGTPKITPDSEAIIAPKKEVPVLCYHRIRKILSSDGKNMKTYSVSPTAFAEQMKALRDKGYQTILPDQLYRYLVHGTALPEKPVLITFDDTREEQYRIGATEMKKQGFKGVFFIMTVSLNKPGYMTKEQIKNLSNDGNTVAAHTWDHHMVTKYTGDDWNTQLLKPKKKLEDITGKSVHYFAYPFGLWNKEAVSKLKNNGYQLAFILSTKSDPINPLFTIRRMIVAGGWSAPKMLKQMEATFNN